jgi:hypothetical protein
MQLHRDHTRLACRRRRLGDDLLARTLKSPNCDRKSERLSCSASRLPAGRQAEHGTPAVCGPRLVCMDAAQSLFENSGARLCRPRPAAASPQESVSGGILATLRLVFD